MPPVFARYYDVVLGKGTEVQEGARAVVHYEARWKGVTFMTSRSLLHILLPSEVQGCYQNSLAPPDRRHAVDFL